MKSDPRDTNQYFYTIRPKVLQRANGRCYGCFRPVAMKRGDWACHHVMPVSKGGTNALDNLVCLCVECHQFVHAGNIKYKRKLPRREYFIGRDIETGRRVMRWWNYRWAYRKRTTKNPRLRKLRALAIPDAR